MKKSQIQVTPLLYVFALVVGALILIFGIRQIIILQSNVGEIELGTFKTELNKQIRSTYNLDPGSSVEIQLSTPSKISFVCFTDGTSNVRTNNEILTNLIFLNPNHNVFLVSEETIENPSFKVDHFKSEQNPLCVRNEGKRLKLILENRGEYVLPIQ